MRMNPSVPFPELRAYFERNINVYLDLLRQMVLINSFTLNPTGVDALGRLTADRFATLASRPRPLLRPIRAMVDT